jgi:hypothetical protein
VLAHAIGRRTHVRVDGSLLDAPLTAWVPVRAHLNSVSSLLALICGGGGQPASPSTQCSSGYNGHAPPLVRTSDRHASPMKSPFVLFAVHISFEPAPHAGNRVVGDAIRVHDKAHLYGE